MEEVNSHFYLMLSLTSLVLILVPLKIAAAKKSKKKPNLPPGPWKLPVIGNLHQLAHSLPHHRLRDLARQHGDLMHLQLGELSLVVVSSAEVASEMMRTHDTKFAQRPSLLGGGSYNAKSILTAPYGDYWRQLRKICVQELLNPVRVRSFRSLREEEVSSMVKLLRSASGSPVNLSEKIFACLYAITARAAFGKKCKAQDSIVALLSNVIGLFGVAELFPSQKWLPWITGSGQKVEKHYKLLDGLLLEIVENCHAERSEESTKGNSLLDIMLEIREKGDLTVPIEEENIKSIILDILSAGIDTSSTTLEWVMFELLRNPKAMEKAQAEVRRVFGGDREIDESHLHELSYMDFVIKETLRLHPPGALILRESVESCAINGYDIPANTKIIVNAWAIGRDSRYWIDPEKFHPERFINGEVDFKGTNFELIPFGAGRRMCPGMSFAMPSMKLPLAHLLFHFDWKLPNGVHANNNADNIESFRMTVRVKEKLHLIPVPYDTASI